MNPLYLGTAERRIFAVHEPAASHDGRPRAAVLCQPWGNEYIYAHRSVRQLAMKLSLAGFHTLRFDYFGTGDSAGEEADTDLAGLQADVGTAIEALKDIAETSKVTLIGLRVGANVAASVAVRSSAEVEALVLWDPILSGQHYIDSLRNPGNEDSGDGAVSRVMSDLQSIELQLSLDELPGHSLILISQDRPAYEQLGRSRTAEGAKPVPIEFLSTPCPWVESASTTGALPVRVIQRIQEWLR